MASSNIQTGRSVSESEVSKLKQVLWGSEIKHEVFQRWKQGFNFSDTESTALMQYEGGPCAVIVPVQAFLLKHLLFTNSNASSNWREISGETRDNVVVEALVEVYSQLHTSTEAKHRVVISNDNDSSTTEQTEEVNVSQCTSQEETPEETQTSPKKVCYSHEEFHANLSCTECSSREDLKEILRKNLNAFRNKNGVLLFLYSIVLTKGLDQIKNEMEDPSEALIDPVHGHGSQSLINLLLTGRAVSHVFDNVKDISGLQLHGINKRSVIGFLTYLEHLRYLEVGWYLKNPEFPIWLLGSETHLTILFSQEQSLVCAESLEAKARRVFTDFDKDGAGFVTGDRLGELMSTLDLVSDAEYVQIMRDKLDPEQLGIVTLNSFMDEFFPAHAQRDTLTHFHICHYNGLPRSCPQAQVKYQEGSAKLKDYLEVQFLTDTSHIKHCLMTKWPTIELTWANENTPSLN